MDASLQTSKRLVDSEERVPWSLYGLVSIRLVGVLIAYFTLLSSLEYNIDLW